MCSARVASIPGSSFPLSDATTPSMPLQPAPRHTMPESPEMWQALLCLPSPARAAAWSIRVPSMAQTFTMTMPTIPVNCGRCTSVRSLHYQRVICAFQPHTYTRTSAFLDEFVQVLKTADIPVLTEIYAARERNLIGISSKMISDQIPGSVFCPTLQDVTAYLREIAQPGDLILTVGAGDIFKAGDALLK